MKRQGNLLSLVADPDNLRLAFWKARKAKEAKIEVAEFRKSLDRNLISLRDELLSGTLKVGNYHYFTIYDPKERLICAASFRERVLHHALMNVCHVNFEKYQIFDSYASRLGKGTYAALQRAFEYHKKFKWFLKLDVRKYFDSIDHNILKQLLAKRFKDDGLLKVFCKIIDSYKTKDRKGLPIGNLTSQYFANHYLGFADHFIKEQLQASAYVRYMDDMVIWSDDKTKLLEIGNKFQSFIEFELALTLKPFCLNYSEKGLTFLGYTLYPNKVQLNSESRNRFVSKMKSYNFKLTSNVWDQKEYQNHVIPLIAFTNHANSLGLRQKMMKSIEFG